jgi:hypothetical protein
MTLKLPFSVAYCGSAAGAGPSWWQLGGATFKGGFAVDLLQIQPGEISDSRFDCGRAGQALERGRAS